MNRNYFERCGMEFDIAVNVLAGGVPGQTVSYRAAVAARAGERWGCVLCRVLSILVQRDHCQDQFTDAVSPGFVYFRAGIAFAVAFAAVFAMLHALWMLLP